MKKILLNSLCLFLLNLPLGFAKKITSSRIEAPLTMGHGLLFLSNSNVFSLKAFNGVVQTSEGTSQWTQLLRLMDPNALKGSWFFVLPSAIRVTGANYFIYHDSRKDVNILHVIDSLGNVYRKDYVYNIKELGGNFFTAPSPSGTKLHVVDAKGIIRQYDSIPDDGRTRYEDRFNLDKVTGVGGVYFFTEMRGPKDQLVLVSPAGKIVTAGKFWGDYKAEDVDIKGHNYFIMRDGTLYTIGYKAFKNADGSVRLDAKGRPIKGMFLFKNSKSFNNIQSDKIGGTYFFDTNGKLYVITDEGLLIAKEHKTHLPGFSHEEDFHGRTVTVRKTPDLYGVNYFAFRKRNYTWSYFKVDFDGTVREFNFTENQAGRYDYVVESNFPSRRTR